MHNSPQLVPILKQMNPVHFFKIYFNIILNLMSKYFNINLVLDAKQLHMRTYGHDFTVNRSFQGLGTSNM
jgi:hypothetical protein